MNSTPTSPEPEKLEQTLTRVHRNCQEMELAGIQLEEVIAKLDREILTQRKQRLGKVLEQGQN
jgi:exonuclease VII small subunit